MKFNDISIQLFEYVSIIHGYVCSIIHPLKQTLQNSNMNPSLDNQTDLKLYSNNFNEVSKIFQSVETLITLNKRNIEHLEQFPAASRLFSQLYENFKVL